MSMTFFRELKNIVLKSEKNKKDTKWPKLLSKKNKAGDITLLYFKIQY